MLLGILCLLSLSSYTRLSIKHYARSIAIINLVESFDIFIVKNHNGYLISINSSIVSLITVDIECR
jgi:hypothetical protein